MEKRPQTNVRFIHCRNLQEDGSISPKGGMTIAYNINKEGFVVGWAAAKCNIKDTFNKAYGRMKAAGRLLSQDYYNDVPEVSEKSFVEQTVNAYNKKALNL